MENTRPVGLSQRALRGADSPISGLMQRALEQPGLISLAAGFVDQATLPVEATRTAASAALADPELARAALQYGSTAGSARLRKQLLDHVCGQDAAVNERAHMVAGAADLADLASAQPHLDQVVLTAGSNQVLRLTAEALLDPGDYVLCDAPTYFVFTGLVRSFGARCIGIASDAHGMRLDALEAELAALAQAGQLERVKAIYLMSYFDNPRGVSLAADRRAALVALADRYSRSQRIYILEDAAYRELRYDGAGAGELSLLAQDTCESVIYAGTFSKTFAPGLRVGFGIFPRALVPAIVGLKGHEDFGSPHLNQCILSQVFSRGLYEPHVAALRGLYARKAASMSSAIDRELMPLGLCRYERPTGGMYVWLECDPRIETGPGSALFERACELGVLYVPGEYCYPEGTQLRSCMRLSFGVQSEERIEAGIAKLGQALRELYA